MEREGVGVWKTSMRDGAAPQVLGQDAQDTRGDPLRTVTHKHAFHEYNDVDTEFKIDDLHFFQVNLFCRKKQSPKES